MSLSKDEIKSIFNSYVLLPDEILLMKARIDNKDR